MFGTKKDGRGEARLCSVYVGKGWFLVLYRECWGGKGIGGLLCYCWRILLCHMSKSRKYVGEIEKIMIFC